MAKVTVDSGVCGFTTQIDASSEDGQKVRLSYTSTCPHVGKAKEELAEVEAFSELFKKPQETTVYRVLSPHLPHVTCPLYSGFMKAIEVAAGLALPRDVHIAVER